MLPPPHFRPPVRLVRATSVMLALAAAGGACERAAAPFSEPDMVRDSAGVSIVLNSTPSWPGDSAWMLADTPFVRISGTASNPFGDIVRVTRTASGSIVVADGSTQRIRLYDSRGNFQRLLGGPGTEPGEFQALTWVGATGDSIIAYDLVQRRLTTFAPRERTRTSQLDLAGTQYVAPLDVFHDGMLLVVSGGPVFPFPAPTGEVRRDSADLIRVAPDGTIADTIVRVAWGESFGVRLGRGTGAFVAPMPRPFSRRTSAVAWGDGVIVGDGDGYVLAFYNSAGRLLTSVRRATKPEPVTPEAIEGFRAARASAPAARGVQRELDSALVSALDSAPYPSVMPSFERVLVDPDGVLWVEAYSVRSDQPTLWSVFTPHGRWLGDVAMPDRFLPQYIDRDAVYGVWRDPGEAPQVRGYRIYGRSR